MLVHLKSGIYKNVSSEFSIFTQIKNPIL